MANNKRIVITFCILLVALLFIPLYTFSQTNNSKDSIILWSTTPLAALDFTVIPDTSSNTGDLAANTSSSLVYMQRSGKRQNQEYIEVKVLNTFVKNKSWIKQSYIRDTLLLKHEQGHFDIAEINARRFTKKLADYRFTTNYMQEFIKMMDENGNLLNDEQSKYDRETNHGRNLDIQKIWDIKIKTALNILIPYSSKNGIYKINKK